MLWVQKTLFGCLRTPNSRHKKIYLGNENGLLRENYVLKSRMEKSKPLEPHYCVPKY